MYVSMTCYMLGLCVKCLGLFVFNVCIYDVLHFGVFDVLNVFLCVKCLGLCDLNVRLFVECLSIINVCVCGVLNVCDCGVLNVCVSMLNICVY